MNTLAFEKYRPDHKSSLLQLLAFKWDDMSNSEIKEKFEWRYEQNPLTKDEPCIYCLRRW